MSMNKTKIEWCTHTWNPVTGCLHGCDYCYAKRQTERWMPHTVERPMKDPGSGTTGILSEGSDHPNCWRMLYPTKLEEGDGVYTRSTPYPKGFAPTFHAYTLNAPSKREIPSTIFVSSMGDLFGKWVPDLWIEEVFEAAKNAPQHTYLFLTKNPMRYADLEDAGKLPEGGNFWYGATATTVDQMEDTLFELGQLSVKPNVFLSIEPLMEDVTMSREWTYAEKKVNLPYFDWLIIGAMSGPGRRHRQPKREWVEKIVDMARGAEIPVFMKENLAAVWGDALIQEFPAKMPKPQEEKKRLPRCRGCEYASTENQGKRGDSYACEIGWYAAGYDDRPARHIPGRYTRTSPPWCPLREKQ